MNKVSVASQLQIVQNMHFSCDLGMKTNSFPCLVLPSSKLVAWEPPATIFSYIKKKRGQASNSVVVWGEKKCFMNYLPRVIGLSKK